MIIKVEIMKRSKAAKNPTIVSLLRRISPKVFRRKVQIAQGVADFYIF
jgi:hypothetical protein